MSSLDYLVHEESQYELKICVRTDWEQPMKIEKSKIEYMEELLASDDDMENAGTRTEILK